MYEFPGCPISPTRRDILRLAGLGLVAPGLLYGCAGSSARLDYAATREATRAAAARAFSRSASTSISVALAEGEDLAWAEAYGKPGTPGPAPGTDTMFAIASMSKLFATVAALALIEQNPHVKLDDPLVKHVAGFRMASPEYTQVTIRMLLDHSSGFPGTEYRRSETSVPFTGYARQVQETLARSRLKHAPGELAVYCNDAFAMVELLIEAVSGRSYAQFVQDEILGPLGMAHSRFAVEMFPEGSYAPAFVDGVRQPQECVNAQGGGGLYSTPSDMARFAIMLMNGGVFRGRRILREASVAEMTRDQTASLPFNPVPTLRFGLGWDGVTEPGLDAVGVTAWHKNGGAIFYTAQILVAPAERLAVVVEGTGSYGTLHLAELVMLNALVERGSIAALPAPLPKVPLEPRVPTAADVAAMGGIHGRKSAVFRFVPQADATLTEQQDDNGTWREHASGLRFRVDDTWSSDRDPLTSYRPLQAGGRRYIAASFPPGFGDDQHEWHYRQEWLAGQQLPPRPAVSAAWRARLGRRFLAVNHDPWAIHPDLVAMLHAVAELPGYVVTGQGQPLDASADDRRASMCLKIPMIFGGDLNDIVIEDGPDGEWLRIGSVLHRPQDMLRALVRGRHDVPIGADGWGEWRRLPPAGAVSIGGAVTWTLFDEAFAEAASGAAQGSAPLPGHGDAAYLLVYGRPGDAVAVTIA